jgi:hypothetical protein
MKNLISHSINFVYRIEDMITKAWRSAMTIERSKEGKCRQNGCLSKAAEGKVYCRKHLHGSR